MTRLINHHTRQEIIERTDDNAILKQYHQLEDPETGITTEYRLRISHQSRKRSQQRGIRPQDIALAMTYGKWVQKQGLNYYVVKEDDLPLELDPTIRERIRHLVVITNDRTNCLVTCYKNAHGWRNIKKKHAELVRMAS